MEVVQDVVIAGAGIAGLATSLGLHRLGIQTLVLESSDSLRVTGFAFLTWTNAWKALDALGIGDFLRQQHYKLQGIVTASTVTGLTTSEMSYNVKGKHGDHEVRCVKRQLLMEALARELPSGTIRCSSKVVYIQESGYYKLVHLADGTIFKTKVLIGCDGVNSVVAKYLGFKSPAFTGRYATRGFADFKSNHGFEPKSEQFYGNGMRTGCHPCDDKTVYWFFTWASSSQDKELEHNPAKTKQFVLSKVGNVTDQMRTVLETTELDSFTSSPLRYRNPWELLWGNICKDNVCVAGDALHAIAPDIAQGGCLALEDGVVLARCLAEGLLKKANTEIEDQVKTEKDEFERIKLGLNKYAKERKWRSFELINTANLVGFIQQNDGKIINLLREKVLASFLTGLLLAKADFDCGKLSIS